MNFYLTLLLQTFGESFTSLELLLAATPVFLLILLLGILIIPGKKSALITLIVTILIALLTFHLPAQDTGLSLVYEIIKAILLYSWLFLVIMYKYSQKKMEIVKDQFSSISTDKCIQVLLFTWGFGGLSEGMAGFGTAVAIPAAILISLGFKPVFSAVVSLISNSVATGFGAVGTPVPEK